MAQVTRQTCGNCHVQNRPSLARTQLGGYPQLVGSRGDYAVSDAQIFFLERRGHLLQASGHSLDELIVSHGSHLPLFTSLSSCCLSETNYCSWPKMYPAVSAIFRPAGRCQAIASEDNLPLVRETK